MVEYHQKIKLQYVKKTDRLDRRVERAMYDEVKQAFEKAISSVGLSGLKSTSMFFRSERIIPEEAQRKVA